MEVRDAARSAAKYMSEVLSIPLGQLLLEEIELSTDAQSWNVTFSYPTPRDPEDLAIYAVKPRSLKTVRINASDGRLESIKIRTV